MHGVGGAARRREGSIVPFLRASVAASLAAVALHVIDDSFLRPAPGTSARDHLVSGLVALALLVLAAGGVALYSSLARGPAGSDRTGLLGLSAGIALAVAAALTLWRSRRRDGSFARRSLRRFLYGLGALAVAYLIVLPDARSYARADARPPRIRRPALRSPW